MGTSIELVVYRLKEAAHTISEDGTLHVMPAGTLIEKSREAYKWFRRDNLLGPHKVILPLDPRQPQKQVYHAERRWCSSRSLASVCGGTETLSTVRLELFTNKPSVWPPMSFYEVPVFIPLVPEPVADSEVSKSKSIGERTASTPHAKGGRPSRKSNSEGLRKFLQLIEHKVKYHRQHNEGNDPTLDELFYTVYNCSVATKNRSTFDRWSKDAAEFAGFASIMDFVRAITR